MAQLGFEPGQSGSKAHALNLSIILSFHLDLKGKKLENAEGKPELPET